MENKLGITISLIAIVAVMTTVAMSQLAVMAKKHHETGSSAMERGAHDATQCTTQDENNCGPLYITQPGKGFANHSPEFNKNYIKGFCAAAGSHTSSDADQATFDCSKDNN